MAEEHRDELDLELVEDAGTSASSHAALAHGFRSAFWVFAAVAAVAAVVTAKVIRSEPLAEHVDDSGGTEAFVPVA